MAARSMVPPTTNASVQWINKPRAALSHRPRAAGISLQSCVRCGRMRGVGNIGVVRPT